MAKGVPFPDEADATIFVLKTLYDMDIIVDKDELMKALEYDRDQYNKGYEDGYNTGIEEGVDRALEMIKSIVDERLMNIMADGMERYLAKGE